MITTSTRPWVIKVGGRALQPAHLPQLAQSLAAVLPIRPLVLVHGGGDQISAALATAGVVSEQKVNGQRLTAAADIPIIAGVLAGDLNSQLVAALQQYQVNAVGLTLNAGFSTSCTEASALGAVGEPLPDDPRLLELLTACGYVPVLASLGTSATGARLNVNADLAAGAIAQLLNADLVLLSDVAGILDANAQLVPELNAAKATALQAEGTLAGGMIVKVQAALKAAQAARRSIAVASWQDPQALLALAHGQAAGTRVIA